MDSVRIQDASQTETDGVPACQDENKKPKTTHLADRDRKNLSSSKAVRRTPTSKYRDVWAEGLAISWQDFVLYNNAGP